MTDDPYYEDPDYPEYHELLHGPIPSPRELDVERLAKAMEIARTYITQGGHGHGPREEKRWGVRVEQAAEIAAIYERLGKP